jgi:hypothetical protein
MVMYDRCCSPNNVCCRVKLTSIGHADLLPLKAINDSLTFSPSFTCYRLWSLGSLRKCPDHQTGPSFSLLLLAV